MSFESEDVWQNILLAAERGWKLNLRFADGTELKSAYITQIDEENRAVILERVGERHLKPKLAYYSDIVEAKVHW